MIDQNDSDIKLNSESHRLERNSNTVGKDFRSLFNTNSRENSEMTIETTRMINDESANQVSRKPNEIKSSLNSQIGKKVFPSIQKTLDT